MTDVQAIMSSGAECAGFDETLDAVAQKMLRLGVGALPICGTDNKLKGMVTDRDIVVKCVATGGDPRQIRAGELAEGVPTIATTTEEVNGVLERMAEHKVRRLPVLDEQKQLVGMVSQADIARYLPRDKAGDLIAAVSAAP